MNSRMISSEGISCCGKSRQRDISYEHGCDRQLDRGTREALNRSTLARRWLCEMGCAKGDNANGATAKGGAVSSKGRCDPVAGCKRPNNAVAAFPPLPDPRFAGPRGQRSGARPRRTKRCPSKGRCDPVAGCGRPTYHKRGRASPPLPDPRFAGALERRSGAPFHCRELQRSDVP
jgi:hypothetical protein